MSQIPPNADPNQLPPQDPNLQPPMQAQAEQQGEEAEEEFDEGGFSNRFLLFSVMPSWLTSFIFHVFVILILAMIPILLAQEEQPEIVAGNAPTPTENPTEEMTFEALESETPDLEPTEDPVDQVEPFEELLENNPMEVNTDDYLVAVDTLALDTFGPPVGIASGNNAEFANRRARRKIGPPGGGGATQGTEDAVKLGLRWLAKHQLSNGSWSFDHRKAGKKRNSPNAGERADAFNGATGIVLMAFLGAGETHLEGEYKETVKKGLTFLMKNQKNVQGTGSFRENSGNMYSHALASIAVIEAYSMTRKKRGNVNFQKNLKNSAQAAVDYIVACQDPNGGGWRYVPREPGDTSAVGWMWMALKSAKIAKLNVPDRTFKRAAKFLDFVSSHYGAHYGYTAPFKNRDRVFTAVGMLLRMYQGWDKEHRGIAAGVEFLSERGPATGEGGGTNMYYNYYATQVLHHYGEDLWIKWDNKLKAHLIKTQVKEGESAGSWYFGARHFGTPAGRLGETALCVMTLEVYYRHLPLYEEQAGQTDVNFDAED